MNIPELNITTNGRDKFSLFPYYGSKRGEVGFIKSLIQRRYTNYYEPFVGGGSIFMNLDCADNYYLSDISPLSIGILKMIKEDEGFHSKVVKEMAKIKDYEAIRRFWKERGRLGDPLSNLILLCASFSTGQLRSQRKDFLVSFKRFAKRSNVAKLWTKKLRQANIKLGDYKNTPIEPNSLYILDPPYYSSLEGDNGYESRKNIDSKKISEDINRMIENIYFQGSDFIYWNYLNDTTSLLGRRFYAARYYKRSIMRSGNPKARIRPQEPTMIMSSINFINQPKLV